jgi:hypothetical protein
MTIELPKRAIVFVFRRLGGMDACGKPAFGAEPQWWSAWEGSG